MKTVKLFGLLIGAPLLLAACSTQESMSGSSMQETEPVAKAEQKPEPEPVVQQTKPRDPRSETEKELWDQRLVHFDFDKSNIKPKYQDLIAEHAEYLKNNPGVRVSLDGHADKRGSDAYNYRLGKRRSEAVREALLAQGVPADNVQITSYGEELPAVENAITEQSFAKNRRVEFHYLDGELAEAPLSHESDRVAESMPRKTR